MKKTKTVKAKKTSKTKKALKRLDRVETLLAKVVEQYPADALGVQKLLQAAKVAVGLANTEAKAVAKAALSGKAQSPSKTSSAKAAKPAKTAKTKSTRKAKARKSRGTVTAAASEATLDHETSSMAAAADRRSN